jgi:L-alanine-DL-glutamate epimerase-like enolase superfamily enzyme
MRPGAAIESVSAAAYRVPTERPEADGTLQWDATTLVVVDVRGGGRAGFGYSYGSAAMVQVVAELLAPAVIGGDAFAVEAAWNAMLRQVRNVGRPGVASTAVSAVDVALWDLKAKLCDVPLVALLGAARESVPAYGSGGFTSYSLDQLRAHVHGYVEQGLERVKIKVGSDPQRDVERVGASRAAAGARVELMVDANGAYARKQALALAAAFAEHGVSWFEEPVSSDDLDGLRLLRDRAPVRMDIAAGEYGYDLPYFRRMLDAGAVDVLQADATRCGGFTGFRRAAALCRARSLPLSAHTAPTLHAHVGCAEVPLRHVEYFHDHVRIEQRLFDGALRAEHGALRPDRSRPGLGLELKRRDAARYAA